jgi:hypothetical protein
MTSAGNGSARRARHCSPRGGIGGPCMLVQERLQRRSSPTALRKAHTTKNWPRSSTRALEVRHHAASRSRPCTIREGALLGPSSQ